MAKNPFERRVDTHGDFDDFTRKGSTSGVLGRTIMDLGCYLCLISDGARSTVLIRSWVSRVVLVQRRKVVTSKFPAEAGVPSHGDRMDVTKKPLFQWASVVELVLRVYDSVYRILVDWE